MDDTQLLLDVPSIASLNVEWRDKAVDVLFDVADSMMTAKGEQSALSRLASLSLDATGADRCAILVRDPTSHPHLLPVAGPSRVSGDLGAQWGPFRDMEPIEVEGHPERLELWNAARTVTFEDVASSNLVPDGWKRAWGSKSRAITSRRAAGRIYGLLPVKCVIRQHRFRAPETHLLGAIAFAAGVSLRNTRLVEQTRRSAANIGMCSMTKSAHDVGGSFKATTAQPRALAFSAKIPLRVLGHKASP